MKVLSRLEKNINFWFLTSISLVFFLLRLPSLFEPYWYGDEAIYQVLGMGINSGRLLYRDIFDNKPPLLYILYSLVQSDQFLIRLLSLIFGLISIWAFYFLCKKILVSQKIIFVVVGLYAILFGLPLIEGNIANAENFMLLLNILSAILIFKSINLPHKRKQLLIIGISGIILGISFLFKIVALFDFAAFLAFLIIINIPNKLIDIFNKQALLDLARKVIIFILGFIIPILITVIYFSANGALSFFLKAVLFNNVGYVGWGNNFIIPQGLLILKLLILFLFTLVLLLKRNVFEKGFILSALWFAFSLFNAFFSQRPYTHYVLVLLPSISLMFGLLFLNNKHSKIAGILTLSGLILILLNFNFYTKIIPYYQNFIGFVTNTKSVYDYRYFFDHNTPRDYKIVEYILLHKTTNSKTFIWGNNAEIYKLINNLPPGRYTVAYHITSYKDGLENTKAALIKNPPRYIIIMPNVPNYPFSLSSYQLKINFEGVNIYEKLNI